MHLNAAKASIDCLPDGGIIGFDDIDKCEVFTEGADAISA